MNLLNKGQLKKIGKGFLIAIAGAALTYLAEQLPNVDFGQWTPFVYPIFSTAVNTALKMLQVLK